MKSTIIIPNYNGIHYLENCLRSLESEQADVIVVDNGSVDGSYEMVCEKFPNVKTIRFTENTGFCKAVNAGIAASAASIQKATYVILLNNDTVVESGFVKELERALDEKEDIFSGSAKLISMQEKEKIDDAGDFYCALGWAFALGKGKLERDYGKSYDIFAACGGAAIYRRSILEQIGTFDENHFAYLEDIDLGYRARIYGYRNVFVPKARVYHAGSAASGSRYNSFKAKLSAQNSIYLIYKNMPFLQIVLNLPFFFLGFGIKILFFIRKGLGKAYLAGFASGLKLCLSKEGRKRKAPYRKQHFCNYCKIQAELWINIGKRFFDALT